MHVLCKDGIMNVKRTRKNYWYQVVWKASYYLSKLTEKYLTPTGSWRSRSNETAQLATLLSRSRRQLWTLGRLALLLRLFSLMQSFKSALFSSVTKQTKQICQINIHFYSPLQHGFLDLLYLLHKLIVRQSSKYSSLFLCS